MKQITRKQNRMPVRTRKLEEIDDIRSKEIKTSVIVRNNTVFEATKGKRSVTMTYDPDEEWLDGFLFPVSYPTLSSIEHTAWLKYPKSKKIFERNKQEFYDDMILRMNEVLTTKYVSTKYGFDYGKNNKTPGKSCLNIVIKLYYVYSGGALDFYTRKLLGERMLP